MQLDAIEHEDLSFEHEAVESGSGGNTGRHDGKSVGNLLHEYGYTNWSLYTIQRFQYVMRQSGELDRF